MCVCVGGCVGVVCACVRACAIVFFVFVLRVLARLRVLAYIYRWSPVSFELSGLGLCSRLGREHVIRCFGLVGILSFVSGWVASTCVRASEVGAFESALEETRVCSMQVPEQASPLRLPSWEEAFMPQVLFRSGRPRHEAT